MTWYLNQEFNDVQKVLAINCRRTIKISTFLSCMVYFIGHATRVWKQ